MMKATATSPISHVARMAMFAALGVALSYVPPIPFYGAKMAPAQAAINVVAGAFLGPWAAAAVAFLIALFRNLLGTGSPLAFPGSIFGAILAGLLYRTLRSKIAAMAGEVIGTGIIAAVAAYPIAVWLMHSPAAAKAGIFFYVVPFTISSVSGALLGGAVLTALQRIIGNK